MTDFKRTTSRSSTFVKPQSITNNNVDAPSARAYWQNHGYKGQISFMTGTGRQDIFDLDRDTKFPIFPLEDVKAINTSSEKYFQRQIADSAGLHSSAGKPSLPPLQGLKGQAFAEAWAQSTPWARHAEGGLNVQAHAARLLRFSCFVIKSPPNKHPSSGLTNRSAAMFCAL